MKPIDFEGSNQVMGGQVPVNYDRERRVILSKWSVSFSERLSILFRGTLWLAVKGRNFPPILVSGHRQFEIIMDNDEKPFS